MKSVSCGLALVGVLSCMSQCAFAAATLYSNFDTWKSQVSSVTTLDFQDMANGEWLGSQYLSLGVDFTDGGVKQQSGAYNFDGHGIYGGCKLEMVFDEPIFALATHYPGSIRFVLYSGDDVVYFGPSQGSGPLNFRGVTSTIAFDRAWLMGDTLGPPVCDAIAVDNIYFQTVPGPASLAIWIVGGIIGAGRRRR